MKRVLGIIGWTAFWAASCGLMALGYASDTKWLIYVSAVPFAYKFIILPAMDWEERWNAQRQEMLERIRRIEALLSQRR